MKPAHVLKITHFFRTLQYLESCALVTNLPLFIALPFHVILQLFITTLVIELPVTTKSIQSLVNINVTFSIKK